MYPLPFQDVDELLSFAAKVCNTLLTGLNREVFFTKSSNALDVDKLCEKLEESRAEE